MQFSLEIVFLISAYAMLHTYVLYPGLLTLITSHKKNKNTIQYTTQDNLPALAVVCAAYNEEKVIEEKIISTFNTLYPKDKVMFYIGTDNCSDKTVSIIKNLQAEYPNLKLVEFTERTGKIGIINKLCPAAKGEILIMTDANVFFKENTFYELVKHFKNTEVQMVCGNIQKRALDTETVTVNELQYMNFENRVKYAESKQWGTVMGAEGGCYAVRKEAYLPVPSNFNVDDFFITCLVMRNKKQILFEPDALVNEDLASNTKDEFRRKARIATGNFQNLFYFKDLLFPFWNSTAFAYLSHKVLRWLTPFFFLVNFACTALLTKTSLLFVAVFYAQLFLLAVPFINRALIKLGIRIKILISLTHFTVMNAALFTGFVRYSKGVGSSVWQPVDR
ncbi:MAG TPA: glycosyltransferase [Bacteroidia bacterium]|nr:glycosyltransferase [Bacteroidia bacterium]